MASTSKTYFDAYPSRTYASPLFSLMMEAKRYGDKAKVGFYKHEEGKALPDPTLQALISTSRAKSGKYNAVRAPLSLDHLTIAHGPRCERRSDALFRASLSATRS